MGSCKSREEGHDSNETDSLSKDELFRVGIHHAQEASIAKGEQQKLRSLERSRTFLIRALERHSASGERIDDPARFHLAAVLLTLGEAPEVVRGQLYDSLPSHEQNELGAASIEDVVMQAPRDQIETTSVVLSEGYENIEDDSDCNIATQQIMEALAFDRIISESPVVPSLSNTRQLPPLMLRTGHPVVVEKRSAARLAAAYSTQSTAPVALLTQTHAVPRMADSPKEDREKLIMKWIESAPGVPTHEIEACSEMSMLASDRMSVWNEQFDKLKRTHQSITIPVSIHNGVSGELSSEFLIPITKLSTSQLSEVWRVVCRYCVHFGSTSKRGMENFMWMKLDRSSKHRLIKEATPEMIIETLAAIRGDSTHTPYLRLATIPQKPPRELPPYKDENGTMRILNVSPDVVRDIVTLESIQVVVALNRPPPSKSRVTLALVSQTDSGKWFDIPGTSDGGSIRAVIEKEDVACSNLFGGDDLYDLYVLIDGMSRSSNRKTIDVSPESDSDDESSVEDEVLRI